MHSTKDVILPTTYCEKIVREKLGFGLSVDALNKVLQEKNMYIRFWSLFYIEISHCITFLLIL